MGSKFFKIFTSKNMPPSWRKDWRKKIFNMKSSTTSTNSTHRPTNVKDNEQIVQHKNTSWYYNNQVFHITVGEHTQWHHATCTGTIPTPRSACDLGPCEVLFTKYLTKTQRGAGTHPGKLPFVWEATPLPTELFWLGFVVHIGHYILYISLVALIAKVFLHGRKLAQRGRRTPPVKYPWYGNPPPYPLSHSGLALRIIFAIIFSIFETFLEIIETRTGFDEFESKWKHFGKHLS